MEFQDYYQVLKVSRTATQEEIQKAYRKLARQFHPDVNKEKGAEDQFKKVSEAYEVLKNPETRKKYDALGKNWKGGEPFSPPKGWQGVDFNFGGHGFGQQSGFSDFFDMIFGQGGKSSRPAEREYELVISLEEAFSGVMKLVEPGVQVKIPPGATTGSRLRVKDQHLTLHIKVAPHPRFKVEGHDLVTTLNLTPWEAVLGATVSLSTLSGTLNLKIPAGSQSGSVLRLKEKGLPVQKKLPGDLRVELRIQVPTQCTEQETELFRQLSSVSTFNPRKT